MPEGDSLHRAAQSLQVLVGQAGRGGDAASAGEREAAGRAAERASARVGRGGGEEPPAPFRGRARPPQPPADDRPLAGGAARRPARRPAVARPSRRRARGGALERSGAGARAGARSAWAGSARTSSATRPITSRCSSGCARRRRRAPSARRSSTSGSSPGIGNLWKAESLWEARISPWRPLGRAGRPGAARRPRRRAPADADRGGGDPSAPPCLPPRRPRVPPLRHDHPLASAGRARADRVLVPRLPARRRRARRSLGPDGVRGELRCALRFSTTRCAGSASARSPSSTRTGRRRRPSLRVRGARLVRTADAVRVPPARARLHRGARRPAVPARRRALGGRRSAARAGGADLRARARGALRPTRRARSSAACSCRCSSARPRAAAASTGTTAAFDRAYAELEGSLFGDGHAYGAVAPLVGISCGTVIELGDGIRVRAAAAGELAAMWPEAAGLLPRDFGREADRLCVLELERSLEPGADEAPDAPGELADAVTALRLVHGGAGRRRARPLRAARLAAVRDPSRPADRRDRAAGRADAARSVPRHRRRAAAAAARASPTTTRCSARRSTAGSSSLFQTEPFRAEQLRHALDSALGDGNGAWAAGMRGAALLGDTPEERADLAERFEEPTTGPDAPAPPRAAPPRRPPPAPPRARRRAARPPPARRRASRSCARADTHS